MRNVVFISHATPQDNDFTIWIASRLQLLGYEVWIDKNGLIGGEKFWQDIDQIIRNRAAKFLLVYSNNICQKDDSGRVIPGKLKDGIEKEFSLAESISKAEKLVDAIILLNIDGADYNLFIGADRLNQIPFFENWAQGLQLLEKKLRKDNVAKSERDVSAFAEWYVDQYLVPNGIESRNELYYSNWWPIKKLPEVFYIYEFPSKEQADTIYRSPNNYPLGKNSNHLTSFNFFETFQVIDDNTEIIIKPRQVHTVQLSDILHSQDSKQFPTLRDAENHLKTLLSRVFHLLMKNRRMRWYEMSNKKLAYFFTTENLPSLKVKFEYLFRSINNKRKTKNLIGKPTSLGQWHYAVSAKPILAPLIGFSLKNHITFTSNGMDVWKNDKGEVDVEKIHRERRKKGKNLFNEAWRDMLIAFLHGLEKGGNIELQLSETFVLEMPSTTEYHWSDFGYYDPKDKTRHGLLAAYADDDDESDDENIEL